MRRFAAMTAVACVLAACGSDPFPGGAESPASGGAVGVEREEAYDMGQQAPAPPPPVDPAPAPRAPGEADAGTGGQPAGPNQPIGPAPILYLAYSYGLSLELPSDNLISVMDAHVAACQNAGPRLCQLIGSNRYGDPESRLEGSVRLRAEPAWLRTFMAGIATQVEEADGEIRQQTTNTEDLTRQIVDTEARLRALTALRDRLQALLRSRPGRLADLLEVERELARVQSEIDSIQSNLAVMRTRVAMSELNLSYVSAPRSVASDTFLPLRDAFAAFLGIIVTGLAAIVTIIAGLIPVAIVVVPIAWLLLRWRRRRGGRFFDRAPRPPKPPTEAT